jgi:hypothetical protein
MALPLREYLTVFRPAIHGCGAMAVAVFAVRSLTAGEGSVVRLAAQGLIGSAVYAAVIFGPHRRRSLMLLRYVRSGFGSGGPPGAPATPALEAAGS